MFEAGVVITVLVILGQYLEARARAQTGQSIKALLGQNEEALKSLKMSLELHYDLKLTMILALNYREIDKNDEALSLYDALLKRQDLTSQDRLSVAIEFASMGENIRAIKIAQDLAQNDPTFSAKSLDFVNDVRSGKFRELN